MPIPGNQLAYNSESLETSIASWSVLANCTIAQDTAHGLEGTSSLAITSLAAGSANTICNTANQAYPLVTVGNTYQFFFAVYTATASLTSQAVADWYNGTTFLSTMSGSVTSLTQNGWTWITVTGVAPATATLARIYPQLIATAASQVAFADEIYFGAPTSFPVFGAMPAPARPGQTWLRRFHHRQVLPPSQAAAAAAPPSVAVPPGHPVQAKAAPSRGGTVSHRAGSPQPAGPPLKAPAGPVQPRQQPPRGGSITRRAGLPAGTGPALKALASAVTARLRVLPPRGRTAGHAGTFAGLGPPVRPLPGPVRAVRTPPPGGQARSRAGTFTATAATGPPVYPLGHPAAARRLPSRGGSISSRAGAYGRTGPGVKPPEGPVRAQPPPPRSGHAATRAGTFTAGLPQAGPPVYPLSRPVQARRLPLRGGHITRAAGTPAGTGPPVKPAAGPVKPQPAPQRGGRTSGRAGTFTFVSLTSGPPVYPAGHPAQARRQPSRGGSVNHRSGIFAGTGPAVTPLKQPLGVYRQQPPPPARGRVMSARAPQQPAGPPVPPLHRAVRARMPVPVLTGRTRGVVRPAVFIPPPAFTIGVLGASDAPAAVLTTAGASNTLTASTAPAGTLTAGDQRTGGPGG